MNNTSMRTADQLSRLEMSDNIIVSMWDDRARILDRINVKKLDSYNYVQSRLSRTNVATDLDYQRIYKGFYVFASELLAGTAVTSTC